MTLKTFSKVNIATKTVYTVRDTQGDFVEMFTVEYLSDDTETFNIAVGRRYHYEGKGKDCTISYVSYSDPWKALTVDVIIRK